MTPDSDAAVKYRAGFTECASEISRFLITLDGIDMQLRARLLSHVATCCNAVKNVTHSNERPIAHQPPTMPSSLPSFSSTILTTNPVENATTASSMASSTNTILPGNLQYQIVPGTLANGKIAAVIVPSQNPVAMVSTPQFIPVFNKPTADFQPMHGFQIPNNNSLRTEAETLWRPWWRTIELYVNNALQNWGYLLFVDVCLSYIILFSTHV